MFINYDIVLTLPNSLTVLRFMLTPIFLNFFYFLFSFPGERFFEISAPALFFLICSTDILDGYTARKTGLVTPFGASFDVAADFFFRFSSLILFYFLRLIPFWLPVIYLIFLLSFIFEDKITSNRRGFLTPYRQDKNVLPIGDNGIHHQMGIENSFKIKILRKITPLLYTTFIGMVVLDSLPYFKILNYEELRKISFYTAILTFIAILEGLIFSKSEKVKNG